MPATTVLPDAIPTATPAAPFRLVCSTEFATLYGGPVLGLLILGGLVVLVMALVA